jgi:hypothetical protein
MKIPIGAGATAVTGAAIYSIPALAWAVAASCVLCAITACTLIICGFFSHNEGRREWVVRVIQALRKQS